MPWQPHWQTGWSEPRRGRLRRNYGMPTVDKPTAPVALSMLTHFAKLGLRLPEAAEAIGHGADRQ